MSTAADAVAPLTAGTIAVEVSICFCCKFDWRSLSSSFYNAFPNLYCYRTGA
jgi:hypothetical protein